MANSKSLQGTPWHIGYVAKDEDDPRRHRARCIHRNNGTKVCALLGTTCYGATHCTDYKEKDSKDLTPNKDISIPRQPAQKKRIDKKRASIGDCVKFRSLSTDEEKTYKIMEGIARNGTVGSLLLGKCVGEEFVMRKDRFKIISIYEN